MTRYLQALLLAAATVWATSSPSLAQDSFGGTKSQPRPALPAPDAIAPPTASGHGTEVMSQPEGPDFGVPATSRLHSGPMHGPTPDGIPGGKTVTTRALADLLRSRQGSLLLVDVLGGPESLPGAIPGAWLAQPGSFDDSVQQQAARMLQQATGGRKDALMVFYCQSDQCWMSYNAGLRAIAAGYTNVLWYRGGIEAWKAAGLSTQGAGSGYGVP